MSKIIILSDYDLAGSGYLNISVPLCNELAKLGHEIKAIGFGYRGQEHSNLFSIIPARDYNDVKAMLQNFAIKWKFDIFIVALDIPHQERLLSEQIVQQRTYKYVGIMPVEAGPLCVSWAMALMAMDKCFIISEYGTQQAREKGVNAEHIQIGIDASLWRMPTKEEKSKLRSALGIDDETFVVLTVADNQERKNPHRLMETYAEFSKGKKTKFIYVTREWNPAGGRLRDYAQELGIHQHFILMERGMPFQQLWGLYAMSDVFLLASKAEGLCCLPNMKVWTPRGLIPISLLLNNDDVFTHKFNILPIKKRFMRKYDGVIYHLDLPYGLDKISLTKKHPVFSIKKSSLGCRNLRDVDKSLSGEWIPIEDLSVGDFIIFPNNSIYHEDKELLIDKYLYNLINGDDGYLYSTGRNQFGSEFKHPKSKIKSKINLDKDLMALIGFYISEGCWTRDGACFSFHEFETAFHDEVKLYLKNIFDLDIAKTIKTRHRCILWVRGNGSILFGNLMSKMCGKSSHEKHLPEFVFSLSDELLWELLRSLFLGDGTYTVSKAQTVLRYSTVSERLAQEIQFILFRLGVLSSLKRNYDRPEFSIAIHGQELHKIPFLNDFGVVDLPKITKYSSKALQLDCGIGIPIKSIIEETYNGIVYNLEVEKDNSYLLSGGAVHNCMPALEAMAVGLPVVATNCTAISELLADNRGLLVDYEYQHRDCFGNGWRYWFSQKHGVSLLNKVYEQGFDTKPAREYIEQRTWDIPAKQLDDAIKGLLG